MFKPLEIVGDTAFRTTETKKNTDELNLVKELHVCLWCTQNVRIQKVIRIQSLRAG